jgi:hypothetical protein
MAIYTRHFFYPVNLPTVILLNYSRVVLVHSFLFSDKNSNVEVTRRCAALSRSVWWNAELGH